LVDYSATIVIECEVLIQTALVQRSVSAVNYSQPTIRLANKADVITDRWPLVLVFIEITPKTDITGNNKEYIVSRMQKIPK